MRYHNYIYVHGSNAFCNYWRLRLKKEKKKQDQEEQERLKQLCLKQEEQEGTEWEVKEQ